MCLSRRKTDSCSDSEAIDARIELIVDLNRRVALLDELMMAARAKRCSSQQSESLPFVLRPA